MKRKTLGFLCVAAAFALLAFATIDDEPHQALAQCSSSSGAFGMSYMPMRAPMRMIAGCPMCAQVSEELGAARRELQQLNAARRELQQLRQQFAALQRSAKAAVPVRRWRDLELEVDPLTSLYVLK